MIIRQISDLGAAAYIMMHKYEVVGRKGKVYYFEIPDEDNDKFDKLYKQYLMGEFHRFDSCIMSLKKFAEQIPDGV